MAGCCIEWHSCSNTSETQSPSASLFSLAHRLSRLLLLPMHTLSSLNRLRRRLPGATRCSLHGVLVPETRGFALRPDRARLTLHWVSQISSSNQTSCDPSHISSRGLPFPDVFLSIHCVFGFRMPEVIWLARNAGRNEGSQLEFISLAPPDLRLFNFIHRSRSSQDRHMSGPCDSLFGGSPIC